MKIVISFALAVAALFLLAGVLGGCKTGEEEQRLVLKAGEVDPMTFFQLADD